MSEWQPIHLAPEGEIVMTKIDDEHGSRNEQTLIRKGRLWWTPDRSMYVYYTPTHWRHDPPRDMEAGR
ncbi:hypothetical protein [Pseudorhodoplanes sp.]|uniref:hypothetical protein n=1 Tax=Pseudorhodoplanes sp. TaxID=1934341 RepID=UPI002B664F87|nr:hypothetical protein [Pseudorhodoplanes sp.]HWV44162.1 hypothetical protein [Pseudorhodoplanes sp.]